jgi:hypothetical protein
VRSVFVDRHRVRNAGIDLRATTSDLGIPGVRGAGLGLRIEVRINPSASRARSSAGRRRSDNNPSDAAWRASKSEGSIN